MTLPMKQGDRLPELTATLELPAGTPLNLTGATVTFTMVATNGQVLIDAAPATVVSAAAGTVKYAWDTGDTDQIGTHRIEWIVLFPGGKQLTVPNRGYDEIEVTARL
jgi:hypothetical protein